MKNNQLEFIILYVLVPGLAISVITLVITSSMGWDKFIPYMVFLSVLFLLLTIYFCFQLFLRDLSFLFINKILCKIPYFRNRNKLILPVDKMPETIIKQLSLEDIRNEQLQNKAKEQAEKLKIALDYTRKTFAPYVSDAHIEILCNNLSMYADKLNFKNLLPIKTGKELSTIDIFHFGWNIWHYFKVGRQIDIAVFLKKVFPNTLKDVELETIKSHLKDDELKGIIKIRESLE